MPKKIVIKVSITCEKCKTCILKAVSKVDGVNSMTVDSDKNTLTVVGDADPVLIVKQLRKCGKGAAIDSVAEDKKPEPVKKSDEKKPEEKKPEEKKPPPHCGVPPPPCYYPYPYGMPVVSVAYDEPNTCNIM